MIENEEHLRKFEGDIRILDTGYAIHELAETIRTLWKERESQERRIREECVEEIKAEMARQTGVTRDEAQQLIELGNLLADHLLRDSSKRGNDGSV